MADLSLEARKAFINHDYEIAFDIYTQAISLNSDKAILFSERSEVNVKLGKLDEALADAERAIELAPAMSEAYFHKGIACLALKRYDTAKEAFEAGSIRIPQNVKFMRLIKECDLHIAGAGSQRPKRPRDSDVAEARGTEVAILQKGGNLGAHAVGISSVMADPCDRALMAFINHEYEIAFDFYTQAISLNSNNAVCFSERSAVNVELCKFDEALVDAEKAIELAPGMSEAYFHKGMAYYALKHYDTAKAAFEAGSIRIPQNVKFMRSIKECDVAGAGSQGPSPPSYKRPRVDSDLPQARGTEVPVPQRAGNLGANEVVRAVLGRAYPKPGKKVSEQGKSL